MKNKYEVSALEIHDAVKGFNFGERDLRNMIAVGVFDILCGFKSSHSVTRVMTDLKLITPKGTVTKKGKWFVMDALGKRIHENA